MGEASRDAVRRLREIADTLEHEGGFNMQQDAERAAYSLRKAAEQLAALSSAEPGGWRPNREEIARAVWITRFADAGDPAAKWAEYLDWFKAGADNPDSCVHHSTIADALKAADAVLAIQAPNPPSPENVG